MGIGYVVGVIGGAILAHAAYATIQCTSRPTAPAGDLWISPFFAPLGLDPLPHFCVFVWLCWGEGRGRALNLGSELRDCGVGLWGA
jgi:hypothetical protein